MAHWVVGLGLAMLGTSTATVLRDTVVLGIQPQLGSCLACALMAGLLPRLLNLMCYMYFSSPVLQVAAKSAGT